MHIEVSHNIIIHYATHCIIKSLIDIVTSETPVTCCDSAQLTTLKASLSLAKQFLSRCPACYNNTLSLYCGFLCSPQQSEFMMATKTEQSQGKT